jgi:hypothetical protein
MAYDYVDSIPSSKLSLEISYKSSIMKYGLRNVFDGKIILSVSGSYESFRLERLYRLFDHMWQKHPLLLSRLKMLQDCKGTLQILLNTDIGINGIKNLEKLWSQKFQEHHIEIRNF